MEFHRHPSFKDKILAEGSPLGARVVFDYVDGKGASTRRVADLIASLENLGAHYCLGYCYLRNERRVFVSSQTSNVWSVPPGEWFRDLRDCARAISTVSVANGKATEAELVELLAIQRPSGLELEEIEDKAAYADAQDLARRCAKAARIQVESLARKADGEVVLKLAPAYGQPSKRRLSIIYAPAAVVSAMQARQHPPQWAADRWRWRIVPRWPQPIRGYENFEAILESLRTRGVLE